jgi:hypothetical protein
VRLKWTRRDFWKCLEGLFSCDVLEKKKKEEGSSVIEKQFQG